MSSETHFGPIYIGWARFVFEKITFLEEDANKLSHEIVVHRADTFDIGFIHERSAFGPKDLVADAIGEFGSDAQLKVISADLDPGFYEVVGEVWYEGYWGTNTPDDPAETDANWTLEKPRFLKLTDKMAEAWLPKEEKPIDACAIPGGMNRIL